MGGGGRWPAAPSTWPRVASGTDSPVPRCRRSALDAQYLSSAIAKWGEDVECAHEFMQLVRQDLLGTRVFVFTGAIPNAPAD